METQGLTLDPAELWARYGDALLGFGMKVLGALIVLWIGLMLAGWISRLVRRQVEKNPKIDATLGNFIASIVRYVALAIVFITVLQVFGVQATSLVAVLGAATLAIGLALQGTLGGVAAGFMIILFRPYKIGDFVTLAGESGTVKDVNLFTTVLATVDNVQITIPNGEIWGGTITNFSGYETRRVDQVFGISYEDDMDKALGIVRALIDADPRTLKDPEPFVRVTNLGDFSVDITTRVWVQAADYWDFRFDLLKAVKEAFDREGVSIPYPTSIEYEASLPGSEDDKAA